MNSKWYLQTWFIALTFSFSFLFIPFLVGIGLLICQIIENNKIKQKYGSIDSLDASILQKKHVCNELDNKISDLNLNIKNLDASIASKKADYEQHRKQVQNELEFEIKKLEFEIKDLETTILTKQYDFSDYSALSSEECKNRLASLKLKEKELIKSDYAITVVSDDTKKVINNNIKQMIRCFNAESDNIILSVNAKNIDSMRSKLTKSFETINKIFETDGLKLTPDLLDIKLEELNLVYTAEIKKEQEKEIQREIKEQMKEEERVRREIEKEKAKIEKDQNQFSNELSKVMKYLQNTNNDVEKQLYVDKIRELEAKIKELEAQKETVLEREANARAGFVYIISNIGSFGEDIYKIGMTRRLEPMDRIKELSSASVPFEFDVHAMIFSDDAPALETSLHNYFDTYKVNKINPRKEFFKIALDEIESYVKTNFDTTVEFTKVPLATEYRQSLEMI